MLRDYLAGLAQTKLPLRARIVLLLASGEADARHVQAGQKDLRALLGAKHSRHIDEALDQLLEMRMIERIEGAGARAHAYRLRAPEEWIEPRWVDTRKAALWRVGFIRGRRRDAEAALSPPEWGSLGAIAPPHRGGRKFGIAPPYRGGHKSQPSDPLPAGAQIAAPTTHSPEAGAASSGERAGREEVVESARADRLIEAFMVGTGAPKVTGTVRAGLIRLAVDANGTLDRVVEAAKGPDGPTLYRARVAWLRSLVDAPADASLIDDAFAERERKRAAGERRRLEAELALLVEDEALDKPGAAAEAEAMRERLARLDDHGGES